ncbi:hypothetical protein [Simkania negevensis]|uniref:Uncharacterized protein n=1 Tax=Simkania negevensis (strain ATCC VR-1471 / DSM 27360 / Z) TaxID=331113 RepID=F8L9P9_SIMNZ|nr:hypothetical protein [Simkania negevensis]CCB89588.1 putative uncharacterized protein [Simkania negevensis Z]
MATEEKKEKTDSEKKSEPKNVSERFVALKQAIDQLKEIEEKIAQAISFMKEALSEPGGPRLKDFWDAKHLCSPFFKEQMNPIKRNHLWSEYAELNQEARRLKEIIDEQTAFSIEQIELAIEALEADFAKYDQLVEEQPHLEFPKNTHTFIKKQEEYQAPQRELHFLKTLVSRLDALRKEAIGTDMRISVKNKLLKRLSKLGDQVFPRRKELIKEISEKFINDVDYFVSHRFSQKEGEKSVPPFVLRDEIKSLQALAKLLTLNTQAFTKTRKMLSECWDQIKEVEKDRKKEYEERSKEFEKNKEEFAPKIEELRAFCSNAESLSKEQILERISTLQSEMRTLPLSREDVKTMRAEIQQIRNEALDKIQEKVDAKEKKDRKQIEELKTELTTILANEAALNLESLEEAEGRLREVFQSLKLAVAEKQVFERNFSDLRSFILDKKGEKADTLDELENLLEEREELLNQVKQQVQDYRKEMGGSGLDFEKAMTYRELYDSAKIHLDKEVEAVDQLEEKIAEIES